MTRTVTINGKTVILESGIAPTERPEFGRPKTDLRRLLDAMAIGESVYLPITSKQCGNTTDAGRRNNCRYIVRKEGEGVRIHCVDGIPAVRGPNKPKVAPTTVKTVRAVGW